MGHKVHPNAFRLGVIRGWEANWFASTRDYTKLLHEDLEMRRTIMARLRNAGIAKIETERSSNAQLTVTIHTAKPGIVIGKGGASVDQLREDLERRYSGNRIRISIQEIKHPELDAQLVAENIASQIERRISHRRAMKQAILRTMRAGAKGVRIYMGGRLRGGEMARKDWDREGRVPLHTLRADIDFGRAEAKTTFGVIGVKCWIYKELLEPKRRGGALPAETPPEQEAAAAPQPQTDGGQPRRRRRRGGGQSGDAPQGGRPQPARQDGGARREGGRQGGPRQGGGSRPEGARGEGQRPPQGPSREGQGSGQRPPQGPSREGQGSGQRPPQGPSREGQGSGQRPPQDPGREGQDRRPQPRTNGAEPGTNGNPESA